MPYPSRYSLESETDSIGDLAEALLHRRSPEAIFMLLTAYMDESGTHGGAAISTMGAYVAEARQWREYERRVRRLFQRYDVNICHAIDLVRTHEDFRGWSKDKKIEFIDELGTIKNEALEFGCVVVLNNADYDAFYANRDRPKKVIRDTRYGVMFRALLAYVIEGTAQVPRWMKHKPSPKLRVVMESGHRNAADAVRLYEMCCSVFTKEQQQRLLAGISFESKDDCLPLASADILAYGAYRAKTGAEPIGSSKKPLKSSRSYRGQTRLYEINQNALEALYLQSIARYEARQAFGRRVSASETAA